MLRNAFIVATAACYLAGGCSNKHSFSITDRPISGEAAQTGGIEAKAPPARTRAPARKPVARRSPAAPGRAASPPSATQSASRPILHIVDSDVGSSSSVVADLTRIVGG